ncbi:MAG: hypothetical protein FJZ63_05735 [Chlamydiae bacterium]|nr:hypothetical protein [Chlamydiota bacterium]
MGRVGHVLGIVISGCVWLFIGCLLTVRGLFFIVGSMLVSSYDESPLLKFLQKFFQDPEKSLLFLVFFAVMLGFLKGRFVLARTVRRAVKRLVLLPAPLKVQALFPWSYLLVMVAMMGLGMLFKYLSLAKDVRGFIDIAVGSALVNGAFIYFKHAQLLKAEFLKRKK